MEEREGEGQGGRLESLWECETSVVFISHKVTREDRAMAARARPSQANHVGNIVSVAITC